jgi:catechol 2,3-dioxygenase-like lactoylglutathione lyase family enzyme
MASPVVHFEIRSADPDATREFFGKLFGWTFPDGGIPGYSYVDTGVEGAVPGGIGPVQGGAPLVTFFVGVADVAATLEAATAGRADRPARDHGARGHLRAAGRPAGTDSRAGPGARLTVSAARPCGPDTKEGWL